MRALAVALVLCALPASAQPAPATRAAALLGPLIELGRDYVEAVESGKKEQLDQQRALARLAVVQGEALKLPPPLSQKLAALAALVEAEAPPLQVHDEAVALFHAVRSWLRASDAPSSRPNFARARALYAQACAACHGAKGRGDGFAAAAHAPAPVDFTEADVMNGLSPLEVFYLLASGSFESAMPSFEVLSDEDRWALAFYVFTFRHAGCDAPGGRALPVRELAATSDNELVARYLESSLPCTRHALALPRGSVSGSSPSRAR